jgi:capsular exopolysaccharide synthesis family protein
METMETLETIAPAPHTTRNVVDLRTPPPADIQNNLVSFLLPRSFEAEQYRGLRHIIEQAHRSSGLSILAVSSPSMGDGKTTTTINLAGALAQTPDLRVLLVDADLRRPSVAGRLGLKASGGPGLVEAILDDTLGFDDVVKRHPLFNLSVLTAGRGSDLPYEALKSARIGKLFEEARRRYDYILVDTPPLVPMADCRLIGKWVDAFLVVVGAHKTPRKLLEESLKVIDPERVLGLVFNRDDRAVATYYYGYYSSYGNFTRDHWVARWRRRLASVGALVRGGTALGQKTLKRTRRRRKNGSAQSQ